MVSSIRLSAFASCVATMLATSLVQAREPVAIPPVRVAAAPPPVAPPAGARPFASRPLPVERLAGQRGGAADGQAQLAGSVSDAQAINVSTGGNTLSSGAFAGSSGVATVIQNSGNNVLIQNSTIVNVQLR